jgi:hypothetical protein
MVQRYSHLSPTHLRAAVERLVPEGHGNAAAAHQEPAALRENYELPLERSVTHTTWLLLTPLSSSPSSSGTARGVRPPGQAPKGRNGHPRRPQSCIWHQICL